MIARLVIALALTTLLTRPATAQDLGIPLGTPAPAAVVETLEGAKVDLAHYLEKTPVLIEFWAAWCANCKALEPQLHALHQRYGDRLTMVAIAVSVNQSPERARLYAERHQLPLTVLYDRTGDAAVAYDAPATSYIVLIDRSGKVAYTGLGPEQELDAAVQRVLAR